MEFLLNGTWRCIHTLKHMPVQTAKTKLMQDTISIETASHVSGLQCLEKIPIARTKCRPCCCLHFHGRLQLVQAFSSLRRRLAKLRS